MRLLRRVCLTLLIGLGALEIVLQLAAWVALWFVGTGPGSPTASGTAPILCIGDSYTYGLGATATEHSYPGVLQRRLREKLGTARAVVNAGWPGQNSREALLRLDAQLVAHRPQLVCVLIGLNDSWTRPEPVTAAELAEGDAAGWHWRWRTWRLLQLLARDAPGPGTSPTAQDPAAAEGDAPAGGSYAVASRAVALVRAGKHGEAISTLERAIAADPRNAPEYHQGLVQIHTSLGQREQAAASLVWLRERYRTQPDQPTAEALATALHALGERQKAAELAMAAVQRFAQSSTLWWIASQFHYDAGDLTTAERELDAAIATASPRNRDWLAGLHRDRARACCSRDLCAAIRSMLEAMRIDRDVERCRLIVDGAPAAFSREAIGACLQQIAPDGTDRDLLQRLFGGGWADRTVMCKVLAGHLQQIVQRCRAAGAKVVLLSYPLAIDDVEEVQQEVATAASVPWVRCMPVFTEQLRRRPREDLYIRDGHCTDAGYALLAETAMPTLLDVLQR